MQHYHAFVQQARCFEDNKDFSMGELICEVLDTEILAIICYDMHLYVTSDILDRVRQELPESSNVFVRFEFMHEIIIEHPHLLSILLPRLLSYGTAWLYLLFVKQMDNSSFEEKITARAEPYLLDPARQLNIFQNMCVKVAKYDDTDKIEKSVAQLAVKFMPLSEWFDEDVVSVITEYYSI